RLVFEGRDVLLVLGDERGGGIGWGRRHGRCGSGGGFGGRVGRDRVGHAVELLFADDTCRRQKKHRGGRVPYGSPLEETPLRVALPDDPATARCRASWVRW